MSRLIIALGFLALLFPGLALAQGMEPPASVGAFSGDLDGNPLTDSDDGIVTVDDDLAVTGEADFGSGVSWEFVTINSVDTLDGTHYVVALDASGGDFALTLPAASTTEGRAYVLIMAGASGTVTLTPDGADTIEGAATLALGTQFTVFDVYSDGVSDWAVQGEGGGGFSGDLNGNDISDSSDSLVTIDESTEIGSAASVKQLKTFGTIVLSDATDGTHKPSITAATGGNLGAAELTIKGDLFPSQANQWGIGEQFNAYNTMWINTIIMDVSGGGFDAIYPSTPGGATLGKSGTDFGTMYVRTWTAAVGTPTVTDVDGLQIDYDLDVDGTTTLGGGVQYAYVSISATGPTALNGHHTVECDTASNDVTLTIPLAASHPGRQFVVGKSSSANNCILARSGSDTFAGSMTSFTLEAPQEAVILISNGGTTWWLLDGTAHGNLSAASAGHTPSVADTYERFVSTTSESFHNVDYSAADDELTILWTGQYTIDLTAGVAGASGDLLDLCVFAGADGAEVCLDKCNFPRLQSASGDTGSGAAGCDIDLDVDDRVYLGIKSDNTVALTIAPMNLRIRRTD